MFPRQTDSPEKHQFRSVAWDANTSSGYPTMFYCLHMYTQTCLIAWTLIYPAVLDLLEVKEDLPSPWYHWFKASQSTLGPVCLYYQFQRTTRVVSIDGHLTGNNCKDLILLLPEQEDSHISSPFHLPRWNKAWWSAKPVCCWVQPVRGRAKTWQDQSPEALT